MPLEFRSTTTFRAPASCGETETSASSTPTPTDFSALPFDSETTDSSSLCTAFDDDRDPSLPSLIDPDNDPSFLPLSFGLHPHHRPFLPFSAVNRDRSSIHLSARDRSFSHEGWYFAFATELCLGQPFKQVNHCKHGPKNCTIVLTFRNPFITCLRFPESQMRSNRICRLQVWPTPVQIMEAPVLGNTVILKDLGPVPRSRKSMESFIPESGTKSKIDNNQSI